ncbi:uncharacterized protein LOC115949649 [Quercus lobata]|uniref:uncharacterized protein LOC115949649 n=1 Tax=Quercus lobata TaxID=97700 RepID=UPI00124407D5|nr:uncharacterized protein LOC115949649 [Quercus lobata]
MVLERLDRAVANNNWFARNPGTKVRHLHSHSSDHRPIIVKPEGIIPKPNKPFKFEKMWLSNKGCSDTINSAEQAVAKGEGDYVADKALQLEVNALLDKESQMWEQRVRAFFLRCGDRNTSYFHSIACHRYQRNRILGLRNSANVWCTEKSQIKEIAVEYYNSLFSLTRPYDFKEILDTVHPSVADEMNAQLIKSFSREEVDTTIK